MVLSNILEDPSTEICSVSRQLRDNFTSLYDLAGGLIPCDRGIYEDVHWVHNHGTWPSRIYGLNLTDENIDKRLSWLIEGMKAGSLPNLIGTSQFTKPKNYQFYFKKHGLKQLVSAEGMGLKVRDLKDDYICKLPIIIKEVEDESLLYKFAQVVTKELFHDPADKIPYYMNCMRALLEEGYIQLFVAIHENKVVGTSMVYYTDGVAGLYHIATDSHYRGMGIGKQITLAPIYSAIDKGYETIVLFASPSGKLIYEQLGFEGCGELGRYIV